MASATLPETKHTPGPWQRAGTFSIEVLEWDGLPPRTIAVTYPNTRVDPTQSLAQAEANGRLIAAAPDLLSAIEGAMRLLVIAESNASGNPEWDYVGPRVAAVRAAIAKARAVSA